MRDNDDNEALPPNPAPAPAAQKLHWPFTAKHPNCAECDREYEPPHENCGECERDAAPATEAASPPERIWLDIRPPGLNPYENPVYWHPTKSLNPRYETGEAEYVRADFSASRPPPEQARRLAEKAAEKIAKWVNGSEEAVALDNLLIDPSNANEKALAEKLAAIILSAGVAAPEPYEEEEKHGNAQLSE